MRVIPLTMGYVAVISAQDYRRVNRHSWHVSMSKGSKRKAGKPYARAPIKGKKVYLHRFITGAVLPFHVDHKNHQTLDYRRDKLEVVSYDENLRRRRSNKRRIL